jgi:bifunctional enzyme CysN/CysC
MAGDVHISEHNNIQSELERHQQKELLRLVVVGSVDDGKSTLIGRLLHDTQGVYEDQLSAVKRASSQNGMEIDFSLFTDGLKAEREQGITIDVAYRYFSTEKRKFIIADTPGHVQYTRNMATGASTANVAVILIDARLGVLQQSKRHAYIASLLGIPHLFVGVNKMDLVGYDAQVFERITADFRAFASNLSFKDVRFVPVSALKGDNIVAPSSSMPWYAGPSVLGYLETVPIAADRNEEDFRYPVQYVIRPDLHYRGYAGEIASGRVRVGDPVLVLPSKQRSRVTSIDTYGGALESASTPMSVTLTLADNVDVSRGDMLVLPDNMPFVDTRFDATLVWMNQQKLDPERSYLLKHTTQIVRAEIEAVLDRTDLDTLTAHSAQTLELNDIGTVRLRCRRPLYFDAYSENRRTGAFVLIDSLSNTTLAAGMIKARSAPAAERGVQGPVERSQVSPREREARLGQKGAVVLFTGLPGAGKTELAFAVERLLFDQGHFAMVIDPSDAISQSGWSARTPELSRHPEEPARSTLELARRVAELGWIVLLPFAMPRAEGRRQSEEAIGRQRWLEVYVHAPPAVLAGRAKNRFFEQHPDPVYEAPGAPALSVDTHKSADDAAGARVVELLRERGFLKPD